MSNDKLGYVVKMVPARDIIVDSDFNSRKSLDPEAVASLAKQIKREGQLQPVMVQEMTGKDKGKFFLIFGFRRMAAICGDEKSGGLGRTEISATIIPAGKDAPSDMDKRYLNLAENLQRENLTPYDTAIRFHEMQKDGESGSKIAARLGKAVGYVNNLIRVIEKGSPKLLQRWRAENLPNAPALRVCSTDMLVKLCKLNHEEQDKELAKLLGESEESNGDTGTSEEGTGEGEGEVKESVKRATMAKLKKAHEAAKLRLKEAREAKEVDATKVARLDGVVIGLEFAMGTREAIRGVYVDSDDE